MAAGSVVAEAKTAGIVTPLARSGGRQSFRSRLVLDYHVHSTFSVDCVVPMADSCRAAIAAGVTEIAFTDHVDHEPADPGYGYYRANEYLRQVERTRGEFGDRLTILAGAEVDFNERISPDVERFMSEHGGDYDFVIGSVHYGDAGEIIFPKYFAGRGAAKVFLPYLQQVALAVKTGWFDSIGHLDLPKRYAPDGQRDYDPLAYRDALLPLFAVMIEHGVGFEINTSGLRQTPKTSMPGPAVVRWYVEAGGSLITTGSDSHAAQTVGAGLPATLAMLELCGVSSLSAFRRRRRRQVPIAQLRRSAAATASSPAR